MKNILISFVIIALVGFVAVLLYNVFEQKPFKFENFKTVDEAKAYLDEHYPLGTDIDIILKDISLAGADCMQRPEKIPMHEISIKIDGEYEKVYVCEYWNNFISLDPFSIYTLLLYADENQNLVDVFVKKESKLQIP